MEGYELAEWWRTATPEQRDRVLLDNPWLKAQYGANTATPGTRAPETGVARLPEAEFGQSVVPVNPARPQKPRRREEDKLIADIIEAAHLHGWLCYHQRPARTRKGYRTALQGDAGFPDLVLVHPLGWVIFAELKSQKARLSPQQEVWCRALAIIAQDAYQSVDYYVWRPADWPELCRILEAK